MPSPVIEIQHLSRFFGAKQALDNVCLTVPRGGVFGLVGGNGAGKTTLIKHILGLLRAEQGTVHVFGRNPVQDPVGVLSRIGFLSEDRDLPLWMTVAELVRYTQAFYPDWDTGFATELAQMFELSTHQKVKTLSRGQLARLGLLLALAHRPELLVLDEPSSGLDPVVRRDILTAVIRTVAEEGRTVLFSSHLLDEVERVADQVVMLHHGQVVLNDTLDAIKTQHRLVTIRFRQAMEQAPVLPSAIVVGGAGAEWKYLTFESTQAVVQATLSYGAEVLEEGHPSLDEIFFARSGT